jgi:hypothetical protein
MMRWSRHVVRMEAIIFFICNLFNDAFSVRLYSVVRSGDK